MFQKKKRTAAGVSQNRRPQHWKHRTNSDGLHQSSSKRRKTHGDTHKNPSEENKRRRRRGPPSEAALELSQQLKKLSREKKLDEALTVFWNENNKSIRDGHHACIMVDMAARCGNIAEGEKLLDKVTKEGMHISVETKTALLKGICHAGNIRKAHELFFSMCDSKAKTNYPNVRTLNTLLRGCLWCAATTSKDGTVTGGVVTAEKAWEKYKSLNPEKESPIANGDILPFDVSSFEYSITLLCQALRVEDAKERISQMKSTFGASENASVEDQSLTEGLAVAYCALARAYTILNMEQEAISTCKVAIGFAKDSKSALSRGNSFSRKRGWKDTTKDEDNRRAESNAIYRNHRLSEIEMEAKTLMSVCQESSKKGEVHRKGLSRGLARRLITRLVFISGGGTTDMKNSSQKDSKQECVLKPEISKDIQRNFLNSLYFSYGLSAVAKTLRIPMGESLDVLKKKDCNRLIGSVGLQGGILKSDGRLDLHRIFAAGVGNIKPQKKRRNKSRRVEVELGAGYGEWIVRKALHDPNTDFIAVELRADRVAQIFARTAVLSTVKPVNNLCVVGADSGNLLCNHLSEDSVDTIYVNHPEPPTQTFGAETSNLISIIKGGQEPAHMLSSNIIIAAGKALKRSAGSKLVVVTDNFWYGRLICATIEKVVRQNNGLLRTVDLTSIDKKGSFAKVETDAETSSVLMFEGKPNEMIGYSSGSAEEGESYFDRLWRAGAGRHAELHTRYVIVMSPDCSE